MTKLAQSRWLDIGQALVCVFMERDALFKSSVDENDGGVSFGGKLLLTVRLPVVKFAQFLVCFSFIKLALCVHMYIQPEYYNQV